MSGVERGYLGALDSNALCNEPELPKESDAELILKEISLLLAEGSSTGVCCVLLWLTEWQMYFVVSPKARLDFW